MHQSELNRAVAHATGETVSTIKRLGFLIAETDERIDPDDEYHGPYIIDWDELEASRQTRNNINEPIAA
ncbi:hypothetical protein [Rubinisphaera italica]|uniref:Uncharacterized protein n=1 Tax=Rubinisphaera italica TaxID=2527969 RepID=A0A5C5XRM1_9PLAN|nr:hypothetical protein [Rubinisphaera italica]TWT64372.1 hypothetical protein Pan54_51340 [Rubinisphaera italica]